MNQETRSPAIVADERSVELLWPVLYEDRLPNGFWREACKALLSGLALLALFVSHFGALVSNHYAQYDPYHTHLYIGDSSADQMGSDHFHPSSPLAGASVARRRSYNADSSGVYSVPSRGIASTELMPRPLASQLQLIVSSPEMLFAIRDGLSTRLPLELLPARDELFFPPPEDPPRPSK